MWQSAGDTFDHNGASAKRQSSSDKKLLAKILSDDAAGLSGFDKACALIAAHGDLGCVLRTENHQLSMVAPLSEDEISLLETMRRTAGLISDKDVSRRPIIKSLSALKVYLRSSSEREVWLCPRALLLDQCNRLLADVALENCFRKDANTTARDLIRLACKYGGSAAIVVQSGGRAAPAFEAALVNQAKIVSRTLRVVGILLHDYVRWSDRGCESMRDLGLFCGPD